MAGNFSPEIIFNAVQISRIDCLTPIQSYIIENEIIAMCRPLMFQFFDRHGQQIAGLKSIPVSISLRNVHWYRKKPEQKMVKKEFVLLP